MVMKTRGYLLQEKNSYRIFRMKRYPANQGKNELN